MTFWNISRCTDKFLHALALSIWNFHSHLALQCFSPSHIIRKQHQGMRAALRQRARGYSIGAIAPSPTSPDYNPAMARAATSILYRSPIPSPSGHPIFILNAAALPDTHDVDYDTLLPYVLARLPGEEDLIRGVEYEVIFFAVGGTEGATTVKKNRPNVGWFIQAYHVLSRAMRKRIQKLYIVHERPWVRVLAEIFSTVASPKFRKKIFHGMVAIYISTVYYPVHTKYAHQLDP